MSFAFRKNATKTNAQPSMTSTSVPNGFDGTAESITGLGNHEMMKDALAVTINAEINQKNPSGATKAYRYLVPALLSERESIKRINAAATQSI